MKRGRKGGGGGGGGGGGREEKNRGERTKKDTWRDEAVKHY